MKNNDKDEEEKPSESFSNKRQRKRSVFDIEQVRHLEEVFERITHYPDLLLRQHLTQKTKLPDKKVQIWFQNRRAKWRKQHHLGYFGGLHELTSDAHLNFVPAPKSNFILRSPSTLSSSILFEDSSLEQQLRHYFYLTFQKALMTNSEDLFIRSFNLESFSNHRTTGINIQNINQ